MMYSLIAMATLIAGPRLDLAPDVVASRFETECTDGRWAVDCPALRSEIELEFYGDLNELARANQPLDRDVLVVAARSHFPPLAELGLRRLMRIENAAERDAVMAALEHPSPGVRQAARNLLESVDASAASAYAHWWRGDSRATWDALVPDVLPMTEQLGLRDLGDLRFRYFASDEHRAVFTSRLAPAELLERIAPGAKAKTGEQVARSAQKQKEAAETTRTATGVLEEGLARSGLGALAGLAKRTSKAAGEATATGKQARNFEPVEEFKGDPTAVVYVHVERPGGAAPVQAAAGRDEALGETVLVIRY
jgi:hypothetical protein